jgi:hypothetical protein
MSFRSTFVIFVSLASVACGGSSNYAKSAYGTEGGYSFKNARATPPNLMVAKKIERPLYIVLDAAKVKNTWALDTAPCATGTRGCEHFNVLDVHEFVRRDLKRAMENYFTTVRVVTGNDALPTTPYVVADVKVDDLKIHAMVRGMLTYEIIQMTWGFALRPSDKSEYVYSFAGTSESNDSYPTFEAGCGQLIENAVPAMLKKWTESGGIEALRDSAGHRPGS